MTWELDWRGDLHLREAARTERERALAAVAGLEAARHRDAATTAGRLRHGIESGKLAWDWVKSLSRWCYTEGTYKSGAEPAQRVSRALFDGVILPRLATDEFRRNIDKWCALREMQKFLDGLKDGREAQGGAEDIRSDSADTLAGAGPEPARVERAALIPNDPVARPRGVGAGGQAARGSRYCLQRWVEEAPDEFADRIILTSPGLMLAGVRRVEWKSPLAALDYYEYRDDFLQPLGLAQHEPALRAFWPENGPQWDALALLEMDQGHGVLLLEAKAHPGEAASTCAAQNPDSLERIGKAFARVQQFMGASGSDWKQESYQLANRLAFLYLLNEELGVPAWLALVHFVNDESHRPTTIAEWRRAMPQQFQRLGLRRGSPLIDRVLTVFIDALPQ